MFVFSDKMKTKGTIDYIYKDGKTGKVMLADFKTNKEINVDYIAIQLYMYKMMLRDNGIEVDELLILQLKPMEVVEYVVPKEFYPLYEKVVESMVSIFRFSEFLGGK